MELLRCEELQKVYRSGENETIAVKDVTLDIAKGESLAITGPSGCGKTTLINMMGLIVQPTRGKIFIDSVDSAKLNYRIRAQYRNKLFGYVVQDFALIEDFTAFQNVEIPLLYAKERRGRTARRKKILAALEQVELSDKVRSKAKNLSGGQRQRVAIARAIVNEPQIILADEPTGSLDTKTADDVIDLLQQLVAQGKTLVMVTHNLDLAEQCGRQIKMEDGSII